MTNPQLEVIKLEDNKFKLINNGDNFNKTYNVSGMFSPKLENFEYITKLQGPSLEFNFSTKGKRPYFLIECIETKEKKIVAERTLSISGMNNFRDMGGYETISGKTIKWGVLYRGDHLCNIDDIGVESLKNLGIKTIIDYRSKIEIIKYPNKKLGEDTNVYNLDPEAHAAELAAQFNSSKENEDINLINKIIENKKKGTLIDPADVVLTQYKAFVNKKESKKAFSDMLKIVLRESSLPVFQHCRGGKDRTGFGAMLLLGILGVDNNVILYDYLLTAKNREKRNALKMAKYSELTNDQDVLAHLYSFIDADASFLEASMNEICHDHGSITHYVINELGISAEQVNSFKSRILERL